MLAVVTSPPGIWNTGDWVLCNGHPHFLSFRRDWLLSKSCPRHLSGRPWAMGSSAHAGHWKTMSSLSVLGLSETPELHSVRLEGAWGHPVQHPYFCNHTGKFSGCKLWILSRWSLSVHLHYLNAFGVGKVNTACLENSQNLTCCSMSSWFDSSLRLQTYQLLLCNTTSVLAKCYCFSPKYSLCFPFLKSSFSKHMSFFLLLFPTFLQLSHAKLSPGPQFQQRLSWLFLLKSFSLPHSSDSSVCISVTSYPTFQLSVYTPYLPPALITL